MKNDLSELFNETEKRFKDSFNEFVRLKGSFILFQFSFKKKSISL